MSFPSEWAVRLIIGLLFNMALLWMMRPTTSRRARQTTGEAEADQNPPECN
jgi:hypothetical protein